MNKGVFIVIDGSDGSGKKTQYDLLIKRLERENIAFEAFDFPQYGQPSAYFAEQYLKGAYGTADEVPPKQASLFFAMDRFEASPKIRNALAASKIVIANRFTVSNKGHHGAKISDPKIRHELFEWINTTEHNVLNIPRPNLNIILTITPERALQNITTRALSKDIHENDPDFLKRSAEVYAELPKLFPDFCISIDCMKNSTEMKPVEEIHEMIWDKIFKQL